MDNFTIRKCKINDVPFIRKLQPEDWEDIAFYFHFYCQHSFCFPIVADIEKKIVGVGTGIVNGETCWLAHIIVAEKHRKKGIGQQLTQHLIEYLHAQGCKTQILISTEMGEKLYQKLGFEISSYYGFYKEQKVNIQTTNKNIRPIRKSDFTLIYELDKKISGENRSHMIKNFSSNGWVYFDNNEKHLLGYYLPDFGEGLICASNEEIGIELLRFKHSQKVTRAVLPMENESGRSFLEKNGFEFEKKAPRMVLGNEVNWKPDLIFSRIGGFYG